MDERYLGDGVYAQWDGYHIILDLRMEGNSRIALEPAVMDGLMKYKKDIYEEIRKEQADEQVPPV